MAVTLVEAAGRSYDNLFVKWQTNLIGNAILLFGGAVRDRFSDDNANDRTVGNWSIELLALKSTIPTGLFQPTLQFLDQAALLVYQTCWAAHAMEAQGIITNAQAVDVLDAYNAFIE